MVSFPGRVSGACIRWALVGSVLALSGWATGCAGGRAENPFMEGGKGNWVVLAVENRNRSEATIHVRGRRGREVLARVKGGSADVLPFEWPSGVPLALEIELPDGDRYALTPLHIRAGEQLRLVVAPDLRRSFFRR